MKVYFQKEDWYPIYMPASVESYHFAVELTEEEVKDFERVYAEFKAWQAKLAALTDVA